MRIWRVEQASLERYEETDKKVEEDMRSLSGTRSTSAVDKDDPYRKKTKKGSIVAGNPMERINKSQTWLEGEYCKYLIHSTHLVRKFIPKLLQEEKDSQIEELRGVDHFGIILDATPSKTTSLKWLRVKSNCAP